MPTKIKLTRVGKMREPHYRVVVADAQTKGDGRSIETIGEYHPKGDPSVIRIDAERAAYWLGVGAQPTEVVTAILKVTGDWQKFKGRKTSVRKAAPGPVRTPFRLAEMSGPKAKFVNTLIQLVTERLNAATDEEVMMLGDPHQLAERMAALVPHIDPLEKAVGPFYDTAALTGWLEVSRQALNSRVRHTTLLACPTADGQLMYPVWQFTDHGGTIPHLIEVLRTLRTGTSDPWTWALWLTAEVAGQFGGKPAWQWLANGHDAEQVLDAARADASRWAH